MGRDVGVRVREGNLPAKARAIVEAAAPGAANGEFGRACGDVLGCDQEKERLTTGGSEMKPGMRMSPSSALRRLFLSLLLMVAAPSALAQNKTEGNAPAPAERSRMSTGTQLATGELLRIEQQLQELTQQLAELNRDAEAARRLESVRPQLPPLLTQAQLICRQPEAARAQFYEQVTRLVNQVGEFVAHRPGPWQAMPPAQDFCASPDFPLILLQEVNGHLAALADAAEQRGGVERRLVELRERRQDVLREMTDNLAGASIANNIPWLMLIIFGVGAATLAGVKLFAPGIQQELIASGQIVQFVTILILLGVILSLGLAQRLQAETLGTLLGGLAGYVLSQGVGRQAQQQVLNEIKSAAATAPPPPSPTPVGAEAARTS